MNPDPTSLDRLHDIVAPSAAPWWPPAPGWYWVFAFVLLLVLVVILESLIRWQRNRYRREALAELSRQETALHDPARRSAALIALAELLKRTALTAYPREQVAALTGPEWFQFLDGTGQTNGFTPGAGATLERAAYDSRIAAGLDDRKLNEIASLVRHWIKHHNARLTSC